MRPKNLTARHPLPRSVVPPRTPREPENITLGPGQFTLSSNFRVTGLTGEITVTREPLNRRDTPKPPPEKGSDGFYPTPAVLRITAGAKGASFTLEFHPGVTIRGGPNFNPDRWKKY